MNNPLTWKNRSPGNLHLELAETSSTSVAPAVAAATRAFREWSATPLTSRWEHLKKIHAELESNTEKLAMQISLEVGKPLTEARGEMGAVLAKFAHTLDDADTYLGDKIIAGGPHPAAVRRRPRGPAAIVGPFNFPLHLGNGAILAHLLAGNPVLYKPSPLAPLVAALYGEILERHLPPGVFQIVQGMGETSRELCLHPEVRSICFTGSVAVGRSLAMDLAGDFSKDLALELGGKNALFVAADADLQAAAQAAADGMCLTAGQRCNGTSRVFVQASVAETFGSLFRSSVQSYLPADPTLATTKLGPVISEAARLRHEQLIVAHGAETVGALDPNLAGHYVLPALLWRQFGDVLLEDEQFVPFLEVISVPNLTEAVHYQATSPYGLAASIFTQSRATYEWFARSLPVGNIYANLPTTFSPSTLPFGGLGHSGNHRPGGKGFARFVADEQALQWTNLT